ncbi:hypothetical protein [Streptomyces sp. NRRL S-1022]|uniref:hypothetical protein n=1 Tax=Streptomyces sp. NRRL S-1022 TaxID=1463880 RepID=UPI0005614874|nr:hypothetical protein [Streptomyces sp. NRRL S-1022]
MPTAVADLLPLPDLNGLTAEQRRGAACLWDGTHSPLKATTAIDLGEHQDSDATTLFLRACKACTQRYALAELQDHSAKCEPCVIDHTQCPTGLALVRLVRDARR